MHTVIIHGNSENVNGFSAHPALFQKNSTLCQDPCRVAGVVFVYYHNKQSGVFSCLVSTKFNMHFCTLCCKIQRYLTESIIMTKIQSPSICRSCSAPCSGTHSIKSPRASRISAMTYGTSVTLPFCCNTALSAVVCTQFHALSVYCPHFLNGSPVGTFCQEWRTIRLPGSSGLVDSEYVFHHIS